MPSHPIFRHRRCPTIGSMVWDPDGDFVACRHCQCQWQLVRFRLKGGEEDDGARAEYGYKWKLLGFEGTPRRGRRR